MSEEKRYDPEDLEKLISTKSFSQLLPEEKAFVLQFLDSDLEYNSLRETFETLGSLPALEPAITPRKETKEALLAAFSEEKKRAALPVLKEETQRRGFWAWFWNSEKSLFKKPAFQLATVALLFSVGFFVATFNVNDDLAQHTDISAKAKAKTKSSIKNEKQKTSSNSAKNSNQKNESKTIVKAPEKESDLEKKAESVSSLEPLEITDTKDIDTAEEDLDLDSDSYYSERDEEVALKEEDDISNEFNNEEDVLFADEVTTEKRETTTAKKLTEDSQIIDSAMLKLLDGDMMAEDYMARSGNSSVPTLTEASTATSAMDQPTDLFGLDTMAEETPMPAKTLSDYSSLLSKLYTAP